MNKDIILKDAKRICECTNLDCLSDTTVLVTGASGLIGTYFIASLRWLIEQGMNIKVYPLIFSEPPQHLSELVRHSGFEIIKANLADFKDFKKLPEADVIIHSAGYAQPIRFMADPVTTLQINTSATIALLKRLRQNGNFLFLSSAEVYCGLRNSHFTETAIGTSTPFHPRASYIEGKRSGEAICNAFRSKGVHATSVRLGDIYGPGTRKNDKRALNSFIEKAIKKKKIELLDSGSSIRTYCYVADAVELLWKILLYGKKPVYNVGSKSIFSILDIANKISNITSTPVIIPKSSREITGSPKKILLNLERMEKEFKKKKFVSLDKGLRNTIKWQRDLLYS